MGFGGWPGSQIDMGGLIPSWATNYLFFLRGRKGDISPVLGDHGGFIDAVLEFCLNDNMELLWGTGLDSRSTALAWVWFCFLAVFCSVQNVVGLMWWSTVLILRCIFSHSLYHALWLFFEKGWTSFSTSPWCSIWFLLSAPCLSIVRHHCTARKLQSEDANAQVPDHADTEDADRHAQTCHNLSSPLQKESRYLRVYFNTEGILYDSAMILYMILWFCAFVPVLVHDERSRKTFPRWPRSRNTSFQVIFCWCYVQPCFPDVAVCQQCAKVFPTWAANICKSSLGHGFGIPVRQVVGS